MSLRVSAVPSSIKNEALGGKRPTTQYLPTIWGDHFLTYASLTKTIDTSLKQEFERSKEEVKRMLTNPTCEPSQKLSLIDEIQRLGVAYHFENEMEDALLEQMSHTSNCDDDDLYTTALRFRLLRQRGIRVSCDVFEKFEDSEGNFKVSLTDDVPGMLSLFEATHLGIRGEEILDKALAFTTTKLKAALSRLSDPLLAEEVSHALKWPFHHSVPRIEARFHINLYSEDESRNKTLLKFAKLDFNYVQELHQKELSALTEWWKSLDVKTKLPYARDRIVECYFWMGSVHFEQQHSLGRMIVTKIIAMISLLDDTYDSFGTLEELKILTEAIHRWDMKAIDVLPEYMKMLYSTLTDVYSEIEEELKKEGRSYCIHYAKEAMKDNVQAYLEEAKWRDEAYVPTMEEYMQVSEISAGLRMLSTASFMGMGAIASKETFEWLLSTPKIIRALSVMGRLKDDIVSHEFEQKRKHVASAVECYMNQHHVSKEEAVEMLREQVANAWKDMNENCLKPTEIPMPLLERIFNLGRTMDAVYKDGDGYTDNHLVKDHISSLFLDPVPV